MSEFVVLRLQPEWQGLAGDGAEIGDADPAQVPDDEGGQTGSTGALIAAA